jgi:hypothetical protein
MKSTSAHSQPSTRRDKKDWHADAVFAG